MVLAGCQKSDDINKFEVLNSKHSDILEDDLESETNYVSELGSRCKQATAKQIAFINLDVSKLDQFIERYYNETGSRKWCDQVARPDPDSHRTFDCTYSESQVLSILTVVNQIQSKN